MKNVCQVYYARVQGRIQDFNKEGAQGVQGLALKIFLPI